VVLAALLAAARNRPTVGLEAAGRGSLHPALLLMLVVSDLFGAADPNVVFWGPPSPGWREKMTPTGLFLAQNVGEDPVTAFAPQSGQGILKTGLIGKRHETRLCAVPHLHLAR